MDKITDSRVCEVFDQAKFSTEPSVSKEYRAACEVYTRHLAVVEVFKSEAVKVQNEISERLNHVDEWFHYKFVLVGLLIGAFIGHVVKEHIASVGGLEDLLKSSLCCIVVAIACTIAIAVDIHIRNDIVAIQQLGSWLAYHAEPHMSGIRFQDESVLFWEKFLRQGGESMHTDQLYRYTYYPHLHFLTWLVYVLYLWIFQNMCLTDPKGTTPNCWIVLATFCLVHLSLLAFVFIATQSPSQFEFQPIPYLVDEWKTPLMTFSLYFAIWLVLITISARYTVRLISKCNACISKA